MEKQIGDLVKKDIIYYVDNLKKQISTFQVISSPSFGNNGYRGERIVTIFIKCVIPLSKICVMLTANENDTIFKRLDGCYFINVNDAKQYLKTITNK